MSRGDCLVAPSFFPLFEFGVNTIVNAITGEAYSRFMALRPCSLTARLSSFSISASSSAKMASSSSSLSSPLEGRFGSSSREFKEAILEPLGEVSMDTGGGYVAHLAIASMENGRNGQGYFWCDM
jgi:hypothetical protein